MKHNIFYISQYRVRTSIGCGFGMFSNQWDNFLPRNRSIESYKHRGTIDPDSHFKRESNDWTAYIRIIY